MLNLSSNTRVSLDKRSKFYILSIFIKSSVDLSVGLCMAECLRICSSLQTVIFKAIFKILVSSCKASAQEVLSYNRNEISLVVFAKR